MVIASCQGLELLPDYDGNLAVPELPSAQEFPVPKGGKRKRQRTVSDLAKESAWKEFTVSSIGSLHLLVHEH